MNLITMLDPIYWLMMLPAMGFAIWAQTKLKSTFAKYKEVGTKRGFTGAMAAQRVLESAGIRDVGIERVQGFLSDHYDPKAKVLRLSPEIYDGRSVASVGVAAHEAGHAIQDAKNYFPLHLRSAAVPIASIGSYLAWPLIILGFFISSLDLIHLGIILFGTIVAFQLITLPVEYDASARAKKMLASTGIVADENEAIGVRKVLNAAALTYVAALVSSVMTLLYLLMRYGGNRN